MRNPANRTTRERVLVVLEAHLAMAGTSRADIHTGRDVAIDVGALDALLDLAADGLAARRALRSPR